MSGEKLVARLARGFGLVRESIARLKTLDIQDPAAADAARYRLIVAVEGATDVAIAILGERGGRAPESYPDVFLALAEAGIISVGLADRLATVARLRDRLVHAPDEVGSTELEAGYGWGSGGWWSLVASVGSISEQPFLDPIKLRFELEGMEPPPASQEPRVVTTETVWGLHTVTFEAPQGQIRVHLPDDIAPGGPY